MNKDDLFTLTTAQKRAFERMRKAHADCLRLKVRFYNNYGHIGAVDGNKFNAGFYTDKDDGIYDDGVNIRNEINNGDFVSWADDDHYFHSKKQEDEMNKRKDGGE